VKIEGKRKSLNDFIVYQFFKTVLIANSLREKSNYHKAFAPIFMISEGLNSPFGLST